MSTELEFTGERFTPECVREIWYEHFHRYAFAAQLVDGKRVLDAACGEGYGSSLLASRATSVVGVDIDEQAIEHARSRYAKDQLEYVQANCIALPFSDGEFDCVISFETLEHMVEHDELIAEFKRVLKSDGFLVISTPDKAIYTDKLKSDNPHHVRELYRNEFDELLSGHFPARQMWSQKLGFHSLLWRESAAEPTSGSTTNVDFSRIEDSATGTSAIRTSGAPMHDALYLVAVCAQEEAQLPRCELGFNLFDDAEESIYQHYYHEIRKNMNAGELLIEKDREIAALKAQLEVAATPSPARPSWWKRLLGKA